MTDCKIGGWEDQMIIEWEGLGNEGSDGNGIRRLGKWVLGPFCTFFFNTIMHDFFICILL